MKIIQYLQKDFNLFELFKGSSIAFISKIISIGVGYVFFLLVSKFYNAAEVGIFSTMWTVLMIGAVIGKLGVDTSIVRFIAGDIAENEGNNIYKLRLKGLKLVFMASIVVAGIINLLAENICLLFFDTLDELNLVRIIGASVIPFALFTYNIECFRGLKQIAKYSIFQSWLIYLITLIFIFSLTAFLPEKGISVYSLSIALVIIMVATFIISVKTFKGYKLKDEGDFDEKYATKYFLKISLPMLFSSSLFFIMNWTDVLMLQGFLSDDDVGIYTIAAKTAALISIILVAVNSIAAPKFAELYQKKQIVAFKKVVKQTTLFASVVGLPAFIIIIFFPSFLLNLFGDEFTQGRMSLLILSFGQLVNVSAGSTIPLLNMTGKEVTGWFILLAGAALNIILNWWLIPIYGIEGAALATMSSTVFWKLLSVIMIYKHHKILTYPFGLKKLKANG
jgi:O-antigen/teichoic acid export membrane protein